MLVNYFKTAIRNLIQHRVYTSLSLLGLTLGISCFMLIYLYVQDERSYDNFHEKADRIYRLVVDWKLPEQTFTNALSSAPMGPQIQTEFAGIEAMVRFHRWQPEVLIQAGQARHFEAGGLFADPSVFEVFSFPMSQGNPATALMEPNSIVLTHAVARKYYGDINPVGQTLRINNASDYRVTGVIADLPKNSHLQFDFLVSFSSLGWEQGWNSNPFYTYFLVVEGFDTTSMDVQLARMLETHVGENLAQMNMEWRLWLQPLRDIWLYPLGNELSAGNGIQYLYILSIVALFILLLACINFVNLTTARATSRAKEVGMRKVIGAGRGQLIAQFLGESLLLTLAAVVFSIGLIYLLLPVFGNLVGRNMSLQWTGSLAAGFVAVSFLVAILAGGYPALHLSGLRPLQVLRGLSGGPESSQHQLRSALVVFQFAISVTLILATVTVYKQLVYMKEKPLGLSPEQVVVVPVNNALAAQASLLKTQIGAISTVQQVAYSSRKPGTGASGTIVQREAPANKAQANTAPIGIKTIHVDYEFLDVLNIELLAGRMYSRAFSTDAESSFVLNEKAVQDLGWSSPTEAVGQSILWRGSVRGEIIGVVADFHFQPLQIEMQPLVLRLAPQGSDYLLARVATSDIDTTLEQMRARWTRLAPDWPFVYSFLDADYDNLYQREEQFGEIFSAFTALALLIACLGLFGLATFAVTHRAREISVRKVLGATVESIVMLLSKDFARLIIIANLIAWPFAYFALEWWLEQYSFRTTMSWWVFIATGLTVLVISCITISLQTFIASNANPVLTLRSE